MISNPVSYTDDEKKYISELLAKESVKDVWSLEYSALKAIRKKIKDHYKNEQGFVCAYCQQEIIVEHGMTWDVDHIAPQSKYINFVFDPQNLCVTCKDCNVVKSDEEVVIPSKRRNKRLPTESASYLIVHPHFDNYENHIVVVSKGELYAPKDDKGRYTIEKCGLLRFFVKYYASFDEDVGLSTAINELATEILNADDIYQQTYLVGVMNHMVEQGKTKLAAQRLAAINSP